MVNTKQGVWLLGVLGLIMVILLCILFFVPRSFDEGQNPLTGTDGIAIYSLKPSQAVSSPLIIKGEVRGNGWSGFEGQVGTVELVNGTAIMTTVATTTAILKAESDWTKPPVDFDATLSFSGYHGEATLIFHNENPSGDPARDKTFILPIKIK